MATVTIGSGQTSSSQSYTGGTGLLVAFGGTSTSNFVGSPGAETVSGTSLDDTVSGLQARFVVAAGASVTGPIILAGAGLLVSPGATVSGAVFSGGSGNVQSNGVLGAASVGNVATVLVSGMVYDSTVLSGGLLELTGVDYFGPGASNITVQAGGTFNVGEDVAGGTVLSGGTAIVSGESGRYTNNIIGEVVSTKIYAGGTLVVSNFGLDSGTVIGSGGVEHLNYGGQSFGVVISGGTLDLDYTGTLDIFFTRYGTGEVDGAITFAGSGGTLRDNGPNDAPTGVISGFDATDHIVLAGVPADPQATLQVTGDHAVVSAGGKAYDLNIIGASSLPLTFGNGATGNIVIGIACYCTGTAILTSEGEVGVEAIAPGDLVMTADGRVEPVVWVGRRSYAGRFLQGRPHLLPVRIRAGALGRRLPRRDLLVSPNHALLLDGVLVPASCLVDGRGIMVERNCRQVDYHHIELARHDVILAEGAAAETFMDDGSRLLFQASQGVAGAAGSWCAPRRADGFEVEAIRRRLAA